MLSKSSFCFGDVFHQRYQPKRHGFRYKMFMPLINLDELNKIEGLSRLVARNRRQIYSFHDNDYLAQYIETGESLKNRALRVCLKHLATPSVDDKKLLDSKSSHTSVLMLSQWRFLGKVFNPISVFYFLVDGELTHLMAEVSNTPWNERHIYAYSFLENQQQQWVDEKRFHVSPFNPMDMDYHWRNDINDSSVGLSLLLKQNNNSIFNASYRYERKPFDPKHFKMGLRLQPLFSLKAVIGIYWQALKLAIKRIPFYDHPKTKQVESSCE